MEQSTATVFPAAPAASSGAGFETSATSPKEMGGTTVFASDTVGNVVTRSRIDDIDPSLYRSVDQEGAKDIIDFLRKPTLIANGLLQTTDTGNFTPIAVPDVLLANARISNKLSGVGLMRADIVLTLNVNAVRFQQGRYILAWCPSGGVPVASSGFQAFYRAHAFNTMTVSQLPHVEIDLATQTTAELTIPFTSAWPLWRISSSGANFQHSAGYVFLRPYSALVAGSGDTTCSYMLYARFENVYLTGNVVPQAGRRNYKMSVSRKEQVQAGAGPVSGILNTVSQGTAVLGKLPIIGPTLSTVSWAADILGNAAAAFGFSKPTQLDKMTRVGHYHFPMSGTTDGFSPAMPLALKADNEVKVNSGVGRTDIDEMSIDFIKQQYAYYNTYAWAATDAQGTVLATLAHHPFPYYTAAGNYSTTVPVSFLCQNFRLWRGGLKFRIKIVKTEFHSGRLIFAYQPYTSGLTVTAPGIDTSTYLMREIVDVRDTTEVEFCVPYISSDLYLKTTWVDANPPNVAGAFYIIVGDALVCPTSVQSSVNILVEVAGAPDMEFAVPSGGVHAAIPFATQCGRLKRELLPPEPVWRGEFQAGYVKQPCQELGTDSSDLEASAVAIGERAESMRQLIKRVQKWTPSGGSYPVGSAGQILKFFPHAINPIFETVSLVGTLVPDTWDADALADLSMCYLFANGSARLYAPPTSATTSKLIEARVDRSGTTPTSAASYATLAVSNRTPCQIFDVAKDDHPHVSVPAYNRTIARPVPAQIVTGVALFTTPSTETMGFNPTYISLYPSDTTNKVLQVLPHRYAGDDYSLSFWCGTVPQT